MVKRSIFLYFIFFTICLFADELDEKIKQIPLHERICMKVFFDQAIKNNQAAHVIYFDHKPVCITCCAIKYTDKTFKDVLALKGWLAFKKRNYFFPHPNFIFNETLFESGTDFKILHIYIINKKTLAKCLETHETLFKERLGQTFSMKEFITQLEAGYSLPTLLGGDELLLGVLLGYGEESARSFNEVRKKCTETYAPPFTDTYCPIDLNCPQRCPILPVVFMGNPHSKEVQELCTIYENELAQIWPIYKTSKNRLKMTLQKLCDY